MNVDVLEVLPYCAIYEDKYKRFMNRGCSAARTNIAVTPSGNVKPCTHEYRSYGNILNDDFSKIWKSMSDWLTASENAECSGCGEYSGCGGACRTLAELFNGSLDKNSPYMSHSVSKLLPRKSKVLERDATYTLVDAIRFRKENSAQYLIVGGNKAIIGNEELKNFMTLLLKKDSFTAEQLGREMNVSIEPVIGIMQYLYANSLIKLDGGKNGRHTRK
jgi:radical SAM protein with 4Fe4S-binding SPASM domain